MNTRILALGEAVIGHLGHAKGTGVDAIGAAAALAAVEPCQAIFLEERSGRADRHTGGIGAVIAAMVLKAALQIGIDPARLFDEFDVLAAHG